MRSKNLLRDAFSKFAARQRARASGATARYSSGMNDPDQNDDEMSDEDEEVWCAEQRENVRAHLVEESVDHGEVAEWPSWHVPGVIGVWAVASRQRPDWVGWWVIAGDVPTEHVSAVEIENPRAAVEEIATRWIALSEEMRRGKKDASVKIGSQDDWSELAEMLQSRGETLLEWVADESIWAD